MYAKGPFFFDLRRPDFDFFGRNTHFLHIGSSLPQPIPDFLEKLLGRAQRLLARRSSEELEQLTLLAYELTHEVGGGWDWLPFNEDQLHHNGWVLAYLPESQRDAAGIGALRETGLPETAPVWQRTSAPFLTTIVEILALSMDEVDWRIVRPEYTPADVAASELFALCAWRFAVHAVYFASPEGAVKDNLWRHHHRATGELPTNSRADIKQAVYEAVHDAMEFAVLSANAIEIAERLVEAEALLPPEDICLYDLLKPGFATRWAKQQLQQKNLERARRGAEERHRQATIDRALVLAHYRREFNRQDRPTPTRRKPSVEQFVQKLLREANEPKGSAPDRPHRLSYEQRTVVLWVQQGRKDAERLTPTRSEARKQLIAAAQQQHAIPKTLFSDDEVIRAVAFVQSLPSDASFPFHQRLYWVFAGDPVTLPDPATQQFRLD